MKNINQTFQYLLTIFPRFVGILSSWAIFLMIFLTTLIVFLRYFLGIGVVGLQEMVIYLHGIAFLFCSAYAYENDEHVRVDIFYRDSSNTYKKNINFFFSLFFLIPVCFVVGFYSYELVEMSWKIKETSTEAGGLNFVYLQKSLVILFPATLLATFLYQLLHRKWK